MLFALMYIFIFANCQVAAFGLLDITEIIDTSTSVPPSDEAPIDLVTYILFQIPRDVKQVQEDVNVIQVDIKDIREDVSGVQVNVAVLQRDVAALQETCVITRAKVYKLETDFEGTTKFICALII